MPRSPVRFAANRGTPYRWLNLRQLLPNNKKVSGAALFTASGGAIRWPDERDDPDVVASV
jgi:hypothetical protein